MSEETASQEEVLENTNLGILKQEYLLTDELTSELERGFELIEEEARESSADGCLRFAQFDDQSQPTHIDDFSVLTVPFVRMRVAGSLKVVYRS